MAQENVFGIEPYAFEPEYTEELENLANDNNPSSPIIPTLEEECMWRNACVVNSAIIQLGIWEI